MSSIILYNTPYITVEYRPERSLIYHTIHKPIGGQVEMLKEALNAGSDALGKYKVTKWLSDDRKNDPLPVEMQQWGFNDWSPRTIAAGWKYWANVVPVDLAAAGALVPIINDLFTKGLRMQVFTSPEAALNWLDAMKG
jgi:hypothetical protein